MLVTSGGCCAAVVDKKRSVVDYVHVHLATVSTHCKYHSVYYVCVSLATQVVQIRQGGVMGQLAQRQHLYNSTHAHMLCLVCVTMMYAETGVAHDPE